MIAYELKVISVLIDRPHSSPLRSDIHGYRMLPHTPSIPGAKHCRTFTIKSPAESGTILTVISTRKQARWAPLERFVTKTPQDKTARRRSAFSRSCSVSTKHAIRAPNHDTDAIPLCTWNSPSPLEIGLLLQRVADLFWPMPALLPGFDDFTLR